MPTEITPTKETRPVTLTWQSVTSGSIVAAPVIESITVDCSKNEQHDGANDITEHPVEEGANVADHVRPQQDRLSLEVIFSNTPATADQAARATGDASAMPRLVAGYAEGVYGKINALKGSGIVLTVVTSLRVYVNMEIESISTPRNASTGNAVTMTIKLRQIRFVASKTSKVTIAADPRAQGKVSKGTQVAKAAGDGEVKSVYSEGFGKLYTLISGRAEIPGPAN